MPALQLPPPSLPPNSDGGVTGDALAPGHRREQVHARKDLEPRRREVDRETEKVLRRLVDLRVVAAPLEHRLVLRDLRPLHPRELAREHRGIEQRGSREDVDGVEHPVPRVAERAGRALRRHRRRRDRAGYERHECGGEHLDRIAHERHVLPIRNLRADAHAGDALRQRDAVDVDVVAVRAVVEPELAELLQVGDGRRLGVDEAKRAAGQRHAAARRAGRGRHGNDARRRHRLRKDVGRIAVVEAERAVEPVGAPARRHAPVAEVARVRRRLDVLTPPKAQVRRRARNRCGERIGSEDERIAAEIERILDRQIAPRFRNAIGLPVVEPLAGDRQVLERLRLQP